MQRYSLSLHPAIPHLGETLSQIVGIYKKEIAYKGNLFYLCVVQDVCTGGLVITYGYPTL